MRSRIAYWNRRSKPFVTMHRTSRVVSYSSISSVCTFNPAARRAPTMSRNIDFIFVTLAVTRGAGVTCVVSISQGLTIHYINSDFRWGVENWWAATIHSWDHIKFEVAHIRLFKDFHFNLLSGSLERCGSPTRWWNSSTACRHLCLIKLAVRGSDVRFLINVNTFRTCCIASIMLIFVDLYSQQVCCFIGKNHTCLGATNF